MQQRLAALAQQRVEQPGRKRARGGSFSAPQLVEGVRHVFGRGPRTAQRKPSDPVQKGSLVTFADLERELLVTDRAWAAGKGLQTTAEP